MIRRWSLRELRILEDKFEKVSWTELKGLLPGRTKDAMFRKARSLGLNRSMFTTSGGGSLNYSNCPDHGKILLSSARWTDKQPHCPKCGRRIPFGPRISKYKGLGLRSVRIFEDE